VSSKKVKNLSFTPDCEVMRLVGPEILAVSRQIIALIMEVIWNQSSASNRE
jgi:hypothetical protein